MLDKSTSWNAILLRLRIEWGAIMLFMATTNVTHRNATIVVTTTKTCLFFLIKEHKGAYVGQDWLPCDTTWYDDSSKSFSFTLMAYLILPYLCARQ